MRGPKLLARQAVAAKGAARTADLIAADPTQLTAHERRLRDRLANGETNGTPNRHILSTALRFTRGGRQTFLAHVERAMRNGDPDAHAWWLIYGDLTPSQQARVDLDDVCEASGVAPDQLMAVVVSSALRLGTDMAEYTAAVFHPQIVRQTAKSALRIGGAHAAIAQKDREFMLTHAKFLPSKGPGTNVTVNAHAQAAAQAAAQAQPSVPTFTESLQGTMDAQREVQRQIAATPPLDVRPVAVE